MRVFAIDPGTERSAWVLYNVENPKDPIVDKGIHDNADLLWVLSSWGSNDVFVIEMLACYGMPVGKEVFETAVWIGRFMQAVDPGEAKRLFRKDVKMHLCNSMRAKDSNIRQALIDRFGPGRQAAMGRKAAPGPLYGVKKDIWAALGVAVTYADTGVAA